MIFDALILKYKAARAYLRTTAHPAYARVRIASNPDDMIAIQCKGVSAVIWARDLPSELSTAVAAIDTSRFKKDTGSHCIDVNNPRLNEKQPELDDIPAAIKADMGVLHKLFTKVSGRKSGQIISYQNATDKNVDEVYKSVARLPHTDGFGLRLGVVYSQDNTAGTQWYPVQASAHASLISEFKQASDPEQVKKKYNMQQLQTGHVVIFKGSDIHRQAKKAFKPLEKRKDTYPEKVHFLHNGPKPKAGVFRLGYFIGSV